MSNTQSTPVSTNPLTLIPAKARATVVILASIIAVAIPFVIPDVPTVWQHALQALAAVAAIFAGGQSLANLVPDSMNGAIQVHQGNPNSGVTVDPATTTIGPATVVDVEGEPAMGDSPCHPAQTGI
ncbi:MAG: hypothetical protein LBV30_02210 [Propionibacteriaceae bacterium]|jgi:hypothetical protein|nr:hypothetical protein [Propionibacteriaceae bacterium]